MSYFRNRLDTAVREDAQQPDLMPAVLRAGLDLREQKIDLFGRLRDVEDGELDLERGGAHPQIGSVDGNV